MGNSTSQSDARSLREILTGLTRFEQHTAAYDWALENGRIIDMFGEFAKERHLLLFQSGNECENWIDPILNVVYKMNTLMHVGGDINKLFERVGMYNELFPETALRFVGFHCMSRNNVYPVFSQPFISNASFAREDEIEEYMSAIGFEKMERDGFFQNEKYILSDIKPKNVLRTAKGITFVIDADVQMRFTPPAENYGEC